MKEQATSTNWVRRIAEPTLWVLALVVGFVVAVFVASALFGVLQRLGIPLLAYEASANLSYRVLLYVVLVALLVGGAYGLRHALSRRDVGLARPMSWKDIGLGLLGVIGYAAVSSVFLAIALQIPGFDSTQAQNLGVSQLDVSTRLMAFVVLVLIAPFLEEVVFRGILYGRLRRAKLPWWASMLVVSALFGIAHMQWNVGIDVFALSLVACGLRELTGSIWAGVVLHTIKNFIAFYFTFIVIQGV